MNEQQIMPITKEEIRNREQQKEIMPIEKPQPLPQNNNEQIITNLPSWSIEPPIEIKRSNE